MEHAGEWTCSLVMKHDDKDIQDAVTITTKAPTTTTTAPTITPPEKEEPTDGPTTDNPTPENPNPVPDVVITPKDINLTPKDTPANDNVNTSKVEVADQGSTPVV